MSIDSRARAATDALRTIAPPATRVGMMRQEMDRRRTSRRRGRVSGAVLACLALGALAVTVGRLTIASGPAPVTTPSPAPAPCVASLNVRCLPGRVIGVALPTPITMTMPTYFAADSVNVQPQSAEVYNNHRLEGSSTGVTVFENAVPVQWAKSDMRDPHAGTTAMSVATWLAHRPFVRPSLVQRTSIGGRTAYRVDVELQTGVALPAIKAGRPAALTFICGGWSAAVSQDLVTSTYYVLEAPRGRLVVIWSWTFDGVAPNLDSNQPLIDSLRFG